MKTPLRIFYDKTTGQVLQTTGNFEDVWLQNYETAEEQIPKYTALSERNRDTFDVLELPFGAYAQDFAESNGYRVNVDTKELEFSYPDPENPEAPQVFEKPLSEQLKEANIKIARIETQNELLNLDLAGLTEALFETGVL